MHANTIRLLSKTLTQMEVAGFKEDEYEIILHNKYGLQITTKARELELLNKWQDILNAGLGLIIQERKMGYLVDLTHQHGISFDYYAQRCVDPGESAENGQIDQAVALIKQMQFEGVRTN